MGFNTRSKPEFQYGDIILVHGDNLLSDAIQTLTDSFYSHAALVVEDNHIVEMNRYGFGRYRNHYLEGHKAFVILRHKILLNRTHPQAVEALTAMRKRVSEMKEKPPQYDFFEIISQASQLLLKKGIGIFRDGENYFTLNVLLDASEKLICSALVDQVYEYAGIDLFPGKSHRGITPADLMSLTGGSDPQLLVIYQHLPPK